ncbi:hypothetical protein GTA08_BOTSDO02155 [Neofusicoccum parvum]|uniref:Uncharacterized protein n=1 Tax=Neofusicoccum parvum TaxID=310453 RepID=A0ACB5S5A8_9PEZI|nr:hypothetical protein GTA08_BOTSDO02155 [Neofusicoccum parvum]
MVKEALKAYFEENENLPESILYFRNCVGEDDFDIIKSAETLRIADAFNEVLDEKFPEPKPSQRTDGKNLRTVFPNDVPRICIVALSKGTSTRFFSDGSSVGGDFAKNLKGGVVVDAKEFQKTSAKAREFDFHLQSYTNLCKSTDQLGFASNTHYFVLKNEPHWKREDIEQVTNRLCLVNAVEAATSYVTPACYSRKICERGRDYLRSVVGDNPNKYVGLTPEQAIEEVKKVTLVLPDKPMFWL